jgi:hypothetical protein
VTLLAFAVILNVAEIKIDFAHEQTTTEFTKQQNTAELLLTSTMNLQVA